MRKFFQNLTIGFSLLILYILFGYIGSFQQINSPKFESYMVGTTKQLEGSGAVFGYIMVEPSINS